MKYECSADHCLPVPLLEASDLSGRERRLAGPINRTRRRPISPAAASPASNPAVGQLKKFDQFWDGTDNIFVPGTGGGMDEIGRLFVSSSTTSNPGAGPTTIDTWVEDWVITDWPAFKNAVSTTVNYTSGPGLVDDYILGQPAGPIRRMTLTFQYQDVLPAVASAPPTQHSEKAVFTVENTQNPGVVVGYLYRENNTNGKARLELWVLLTGYIFPSQPGEGTQMVPLPSATSALAAVASPAAFIEEIAKLILPVAYYVETAGIFLPV